MCLSYSSLVLKVLLSSSHMNLPSEVILGSIFVRAVRDRKSHLPFRVKEEVEGCNS